MSCENFLNRVVLYFQFSLFSSGTLHVLNGVSFLRSASLVVLLFLVFQTVNSQVRKCSAPWFYSLLVIVRSQKFVINIANCVGNQTLRDAHVQRVTAACTLDRDRVKTRILQVTVSRARVIVKDTRCLSLFFQSTERFVLLFLRSDSKLKCRLFCLHLSESAFKHEIGKNLKRCSLKYFALCSPCLAI